MPYATRLAKLQQIHTEKAPQIIRIASDAKVSNRHKQLLYACLNNLCRISARLFGEISSVPGNYDLLEQAAALDEALLQLRRLVGRNISVRVNQAA
ncbi:hypothetical protein [Hoeflea olei]|uniref:Uncharacterized protein n=1 Tax=Hoeflea olei TaxID=1480615 RepID=A0A1C1YSV9_9HYPH|nr:hypothetical protein [Hoeflea olei]OCW56613.1 hypothetical protein AWJ14_16880 [Hoeflea olei]